MESGNSYPPHNEDTLYNSQQQPSYQQGPFKQPYNPQQQPFQPQDAWQQPHMPPAIVQSPPKKKRWYRRPWGIALIAVLVLGLCGIYSISTIMTNASKPNSNTASTAHSNNTSTKVVAKSTSAPRPTLVPTHKPIPTTKATQVPNASTATHGTPELGGLISDFVGKYGLPNNHSIPGMDHFLRTASSLTVTDGLIVTNILGTKNVDSIKVAAINSAIWTQAIAKTLCMSYVPTDAHQIKQVPLTTAQGYDVIYVSSWLATRFSASDFTDSNQNTVQAGTFDIQYLVKLDGSIDSCSIQIGSQQTQ